MDRFKRSLVAVNAFAYRRYQEAWAAQTASEAPDWGLVLECAEDVAETTTVLVAHGVNVGDPILTPDGPMIVAAVAEGRVVLTADGLPADLGSWAAGHPGEMVMYQTWSRSGRESHGFVDAGSRQLVQVG